MKKEEFLVWVVYQANRLVLGLWEHPYKTVREIMRGEYFRWLLLWPAWLLGLVVLVARVAYWLVELNGFWRTLVGLLLCWLVMYLLLWQGLLIYLGVRFREIRK